jgi:hypothetical protein
LQLLSEFFHSRPLACRVIDLEEISTPLTITEVLKFAENPEDVKSLTHRIDQLTEEMSLAKEAYDRAVSERVARARERLVDVERKIKEASSLRIGGSESSEND